MIDRSILDLEAKCSRLEHLLNEYNNKVDDLCKAALHTEQFLQSINKSNSDSAEQVDAEKKSLQEFKTGVSNAFKCVEEDFHSLINGCQALSNEIDQQQKNIDNCKEKTDLYFQTSNENLSSLRSDLQKEITEKISAIPPPQVPSQYDINKAIEFKLEPVSIDAKNGVLRSSNCEMKITIMEKKIDQIFLLLQKHSLNT